jgi:hypothetical protein
LELHTQYLRPTRCKGPKRRNCPESVVEGIKSLSWNVSNLLIAVPIDQLQEVKYQDEKIQAQLKLLSVVERMKRSQEQHCLSVDIHTIQSRVMEVT